MAGGNERPGSPNIGKVLECHGYENDWNLSGMAIPRFQGRNPSYTSSPRGGKDRKSRVAGYERLLSGMEIPRYQSRNPQRKQLKAVVSRH